MSYVPYPAQNKKPVPSTPASHVEEKLGPIQQPSSVIPEAIATVTSSVADWLFQHDGVLIKQGSNFMVSDHEDPFMETCSACPRSSPVKTNEEAEIAGVRRLPAALATLKLACESKAGLAEHHRFKVSLCAKRACKQNLWLRMYYLYYALILEEFDKVSGCADIRS